MRALTLLFTFLISFPLTLSAQAAGDVLQKVSEAMAAEPMGTGCQLVPSGYST